MDFTNQVLEISEDKKMKDKSKFYLKLTNNENKEPEVWKYCLEKDSH